MRLLLDQTSPHVVDETAENQPSPAADGRSRPFDRPTGDTMKHLARPLLAAALFGVALSAQAYDPKTTIADLDARLAKIGAAKLDGTEVVAGKTVPALYFGDRKINNNYDVVDAVRKAHNATATVFVKEGDEFVRVSTNVLTTEGKRGVGTQLARNAAYDSVSKGQGFCGTVDVLGTAFDACYNPIKDGGGKIIGASYIGHKK
jgi:Cache 3/Cache 2 fusion domain